MDAFDINAGAAPFTATPLASPKPPAASGADDYAVNWAASEPGAAPAAPAAGAPLDLAATAMSAPLRQRPTL